MNDLNKGKYRVLIVDDHPFMRQGYSNVLSTKPSLEICGEASNTADAIRLVRSLQPDIAVVDLSLDDSHGLDLIKRISESKCRTKVLVSSMHDESLYAERCIRAGAKGYVNKAEAPETFVDALFVVLEGDVFLSPKMTRRILKGVSSGSNGEIENSIDTLTDRELEVFGLIGRGLTTREIATQLRLSVKTIDTYRDNIKTKLELKSPAELARHAVQWVLESGT